ncbi:MAG: hypothetical protein IDH49_10990 [Gammaproteobacteria bacterium]|nr:hypothetical protein [Gammaproteobacteria bacterium]
MMFSNILCAGVVTGQVDYVLVRASDGLIYVGLRNATVLSPAPTCATISYWMIKDENSNAGKQQLATLLAAQVAGKTITIWGSNTCARWRDGEDIDAVRIQ